MSCSGIWQTLSVNSGPALPWSVALLGLEGAGAPRRQGPSGSNERVGQASQLCPQFPNNDNGPKQDRFHPIFQEDLSVLLPKI